VLKKKQFVCLIVQDVANRVTRRNILKDTGSRIGIHFYFISESLPGNAIE
jgi:hypothetical protein